ncbi:fasciculation and elongation protein zeta-2 [Galendromus occidentalis]|uniref:Fasciculation and elongation protein zeta-2 n=1 Tax=Galendromus occidentalis TaxID=34638 RepID=A0AAJ6QTH1_9ACAR|nr:fasciculation and elongation protein zeta-2 [Galendromus occidentalis]
MVMGDVKMASELLAEAPLASAEEDFSDFNCNKLIDDSQRDGNSVTRNDNAKQTAGAGICGGGNNEALLGFEDSSLGAFSASLEDLVSSFDEKITKCLRDYDQTTDQIAPVQVRSQEEIMKTDQVWWTLTGNYGNIMPIDWSKSYARKMQLDALNINEHYNDCHTLRHSVDSSDEEDLDRDLDLHSLILSSLQSEPPNVQSADEVIQQIEDIMAESCSSDDGIASGETTPVNTPDRGEVPVDKDDSLRAQIAGLIRSDHIKSLSVAELVEVHSALEREIQTLSETLVAELAQRDELDFEKETKNTFISLLLTVQNKRRQFTIDRKRGRGHTIVNGEPKYLTTVIPYNPAVGAKVSVSELQILIKILHAINDDSPTVPTLLTDYILKGTMVL